MPHGVLWSRPLQSDPLNRETGDRKLPTTHETGKLGRKWNIQGTPELEIGVKVFIPGDLTNFCMIDGLHKRLLKKQRATPNRRKLAEETITVS
jgi:hypothetical protein